MTLAEMPQTFGRYRLLAPLGHDAEAEVFRGALPGLDGFEKPVVIRRLADPERHGSAAIARFMDRAHAAASVQHPNAVQVFEVGNGPNGEPFMVEGWVPGPSLDALLRRVRQAGHRLPTWFALHVAGEVLAALVYGAAKGVTHGDIEADRIRLSYDGEVRLTGFGQRVAAQDHLAVRDLLCETMGLATDTADLPESIRSWIGGREQGDLSTCHRWVRQARAALKPRVTLLDVTATISAIEADAHDWCDEIPESLAKPASSASEDRIVTAAIPRIEDGPVTAPGPTEKTTTTGCPSATDGAERAGEDEQTADLLRPPPMTPTLFDFAPSVEEPPAVEPSSTAAPSAEIASPPAVAPSDASLSLPSAFAAPPAFSEGDPTDPSRSPVEVTPTMEIRPGRRADVQVWLEVPPAVVGPRRLDEGLRLIRELGAVRQDLSLSVNGQHFVPLQRVARQLQDSLQTVGDLDPAAPVQGVLADKTVLQVIGERARARDTGRLTFQRHEPDFPERISLDLVDGHLVDGAASTAPLSAWTKLLTDADLPDGVALRAFAVVIAEDIPIADVGSPLLLTALTQARAECAEAQLDVVLGWPWARFTFVPRPAPVVADRVTDVPLLSKLWQWVLENEKASVLLSRLSPVLHRTMTRSDDFEVVLSRLRPSPELMAFANRLGHGDAARDALNQIESTQPEPHALALTYVLVQLGALIPA